MVAAASNSEQHRVRWIGHPAVRIGLGIGVAASLVLIAWVFLANRVPSLETLAMERNVAAEAVLGMLALIPVVVFFREPGQLLVSGLTAWSLLSFTYWLLTLYFTALSERLSTTQLVAKGFLGYLIAMVLTWVLSCIQRVRHSRVSHLRPGAILSDSRVPPSDSVARLS
jgi:hypothetical protein